MSVRDERERETMGRRERIEDVIYVYGNVGV